MGQKKLISIIGPTAIGKTRMAIAIAQYFNTVIISADSRQFYKEMSIGTAVPSKEELNTVPHYFIQHKSIFDEYSVGDFEKEAVAMLKKLFIANDVVVMVGGSGLYVDALVNGLDNFPKVDPAIRESLNTILDEKGIQDLQDTLRELDPLYVKKVDMENPHRLIRALEVSIGTGKPYSSFLDNVKSKRFFDTITLGISAEREIIYSRINQRVNQMMAEGLLMEAESLKGHKERNALHTVGYKELFSYFDGKWDLPTAITEIKKNTRRFAKRQLTWYRKREDILWVKYDEPIESILDDINNYMERNFETNGK